MIGGWTTSSRREVSAAKDVHVGPVIPQTETTLSSSSTTRIIFGRIVSNNAVGPFGREIIIQDDNKQSNNEGDETDAPGRIRVHLDAKRYPDTAVWMTMRGARKLICPGVSLHIHGISVVGCTDIWAMRIMIVGALPATPYLARLLSFSFETLHSLFRDGDEQDDEQDSTQPPLGLVCALRPYTVQQCHDLCRSCQIEEKEGRSQTLFKKKELVQLCEKIRLSQGWSRDPRAPPSTSAQTWAALLAMEEQWCRKEADGGDTDADEQDCAAATAGQESSGAKEHQPAHTSTSVSDHIVYDGVNVDPSLNLPDQSDKRRIAYVDQRKRPQVLWMLGLIRRLVGCADDTLSCNAVESTSTASLEQDAAPNGATRVKNVPQVLHFADIGGGRGDLANAVAAFFAQPHILFSAHVTVVDVNQSSLDAGRERAAAANLGSVMSFVLCDLSDETQVAALLDRQRFHLVFGLHCCGGLAETAVELALASRASFCVSTCCFRSNEHLASLSSLANDIIASETTTECVEQHQSYRALVSMLAVTVGGQGQHRAMRALNAMRLVAAEKRFQALYDVASTVLPAGEDNIIAAAASAPSPAATHILFSTWQESFPVQFSVQNRIMIGTVC
jgi:hypothetical protein